VLIIVAHQCFGFVRFVCWFQSWTSSQWSHLHMATGISHWL